MSSTAAIPQTTGDAEPGTTRAAVAKPWLVAVFCFMVPTVPTIAVLPGPLRGNGSPARLIGFLCIGLILLAFVFAKRPRQRGTQAVINPGVVILLVYFFLLLITFGTGQLDVGNEVIESSKTRTLLVLIADVGIAMYAMRTVRNHRDRTFVLGFLAAGLTWACFVGLLQSFSLPDLRFALVPPGLVNVTAASEVTDRQGALRVLGTSDHAIEFSVLAAVAVPITFHLARFAMRSLHRQLSAIACVLCFLAVPAAVSRSGALALIVIFVIYAFAINVRLLGNVTIIGTATILAYKIVYPNSINALWATFLGRATT